MRGRNVVVLGDVMLDVAIPAGASGDLFIAFRPEAAWLSGQIPHDRSRQTTDALDLFLRESNRLVPRETIAREVWGGACEPDANVIEVYIRRLRRKLQDAQYAGRIRTMWGVGYVLEHDSAAEPAVLT